MTEEIALPSAAVTNFGFGDATRFEHMQRVAKMFSESQLVPVVFQKNIANCVIALEISQRMNASPFMVMQNLNIIYGKPSFGSSFNIASVNASGRFTPLRFVWVGTTGQDDWGCYATSKARDGFECKGTTITMGLAKAEGWVGRKDSKWKTMPELMMQYRAATWWTRMFAPELLMGFKTTEELVDVEALPLVNGEDLPEKGAALDTSKRVKKGIAAMAAAPEVPAGGRETPTSGTGSVAAEAQAMGFTPEAGKVLEQAAKPEPQPPVDNAHVEPGAERFAEPAKGAAENPAAAAATPAAPPPVAEPKKETTTAPLKTRCEVTGVTETQAKKSGGTTGPVCKVSYKSFGPAGEVTGLAYFDGAKEKAPAVGAVVDAVLIDSKLKNEPVKVLQSFEVLA